MKAKKILVVEDDPIIAEDIAMGLEDIGHKVCGIFYAANKAKEALSKLKPDLALLDIDLGGGMDGIDIAHHLNTLQIPFVFLTSFADQSTLERVKATKPYGYIVKPFDEKELFATIDLAFFQFEERKREAPIRLGQINMKLPTPLTEREFEILTCILEGLTNKQIADKLHLSTNTIKTHLSNLYSKLGANSRTTAISKLRGLGR